MDEDDGAFGHALGARGSHIVLIEIVEHRGAHEATDLGGVEQPQHHHRHGHLLDLGDETAPVRDAQRGIVDRRQPLQVDAENDDEQKAGEEGRH